MEVKICGVCRPGDAAVVAAAGADFIGVILGARSPRLRSMEEAVAIYAAAPGVQRVGVFADAPLEMIVSSARAARLDVVQLHGSEPATLVAAVGAAGRWTVWKGLRPRSADELERAIDAYAGVAGGLLIDGWSPRGAGGLGVVAPWQQLAAARERIPADVTFILAGGLTADNVGAGIDALRPDAVDVSSGVERTLGAKSPEAVRAFVAAARGAAASGVEA